MARTERLFLAVLLTIPLQLNKFFPLPFSYVLGIPIDYRIPSIYLSDILIVLFLLSSISSLKKIKDFCSDKKWYLLVVVTFLTYLTLCTFFIKESKEATLFFLIKLVELVAFSVPAAYYLSQKKVFTLALRVFKFTLTWQSLVVVYQFITQRSLGLWFLGERSFDTTTTGIAHIEIFQNQFLRPYGTFPHPNVMGAFSLVLLIILAGSLKNSDLYPLPKKTIIPHALAAISIVASFSKTALIMLFVSPVVIVKKRTHLVVAALTIIILVLIYVFALLPRSINAIAERILLSQAALLVASQNIILGVGSNNFILAISKLNLQSVSEVRLLQPVHNVFLLILAENGLLGLLLFSLVLLTVSKFTKDKARLFLFFVVLVYLSIDHFMWTLQQGQLILWLSVSYILSSQKNSSS